MAWVEPAAPISITTRARGVPLEVVLRAVFRHFLPGASAVIVPPLALLLLLNPFDWITNVPVPLGMLVSLTVGFRLGLLALSPLPC